MDESGRVAEQMPQNIGRYQVQASIGFGAMGAVYKAFDPLIKRTLAIKTIRLDIPRASPQYKSFIDRFYHEARISGTLSHPNIVTLFDIGEENGLPYLAMEFVEGETIASQLEHGIRFKPERVINLISQVASALDYAHSKGVIHRDIKPSNLILAQDDRVKVTDFGIAKLIDAEMTQSGTLLGTPSYMSPEQAMGEKLDGRSDIFSLGVCAFEMLSGEQPFPGNNVTSILYKLVHVDPIEPADLEMNGLVPQKWHEVFGKVLAKKPDERYQTATEFVQDLEYCLGSWFGAVPDMTLTQPPVEEATAVLPGLSTDATATGVPAEGATMALPVAPAEEATRVLNAVAVQATDSSSEGTVLMPSPVAGTAPKTPPQAVEGTVLMPGLANPQPSDGTVLLPIPAASSLQPPAAASAEGTVLMPAPVPVAPPAEGTVLMPAPHAAPRVEARPRMPPPAPPPIGLKPLAPARQETASAAIPPVEAPPRKGAPMLLILGGMALLGLMFAGAGMLWLLRSRVVPAPTPMPAVPTTQAAAPTPEPTLPPVIKGSLKVASEPPGATVNVDGQELGVTPLEVSDLELGDHELRLALKGYSEYTQPFALTAEAPGAEVTAALSKTGPPVGFVEVRSTPPGALVRINGLAVGQTPLRNHRLKVGGHEIELIADGYQPWSGKLQIRDGRREKVEAQLSPVQRATPPPTPAPDVVDPSRTYLEEEVDLKPRRISGEGSPYPKGARKLKSGESVSVTISLVVAEDGSVSGLQVAESSGQKVVDDAVLAAAGTWKFAPGAKKGIKVKTRVNRRQTFRAE